LNPNTIAQKVSIQHVGMLLNHYPKTLLSIFVWIFGNLISWHYIPRGAKYGCCWPSGYGNSWLAISRPFSSKYVRWFAWPTIKIFWGATMNVVTSTTHSKLLFVYILGNVLPFCELWLQVLMTWQQIHVWLWKPFFFYVASMRSWTHQLQWCGPT
jgi:hypothetical protein